MNSSPSVLESELVKTIALVAVPYLLGRLFAWWKDQCRLKRDERRLHALEALEAGVAAAWETYGRKWKAASADGKLADSERAELRTFARETAVEVGREEGLDALKALGEGLVDSVIAKIVRGRKRS